MTITVQASSASNDKLKAVLQENVSEIKDRLGNSADFVVRELKLGRNGELKCALVYLDGLCNQDDIFRLMESLLAHTREIGSNVYPDVIEELIITVGNKRYETELQTVLQHIVSGETVLLVDGFEKALVVSTKGWEHRQVSEPQTQTVIRGSHEGFTEDILTNITLVRRRVKDANVWVERKKIGRITQTDVALMYINGTVKKKVLQEVRDRLKKIDIDGILESNYIEEFIQDKKSYIFPTVNNSERPDVIAAEILEGRVAIFIDGTPYVLIVPAGFTQFLQSAEDYYHHSDYGLLRLLRYLAVFISVLAPAFFIAILTFHQEMMPPVLLVSIAGQREGVPFPTLVEALVMETVFELLREASVRMPRAVGTAMSIVGALVLGEAAVTAGLVSAAMVIIVAVTAIAGFIFPSFEIGISFRILRFGFMLLAGFMGFFGITIGIIVLTLHLCRLQSFGIPYMAPIAPFNWSDQKDTIARVPWWQMYTRPAILDLPNKRRQPADQSNKPGGQQQLDDAGQHKNKE